VFLTLLPTLERSTWCRITSQWFVAMAVTRRGESESGGESKPYMSVVEGEAVVATDQLGNINHKLPRSLLVQYYAKFLRLLHRTVQNIRVFSKRLQIQTRKRTVNCTESSKV
jgi:hypothetical protein